MTTTKKKREAPPGVYASLNGRALSPEANALVHRVSTLVLEWEGEHAPRKARSKAEEAGLHYAIEAFLCDLVRAMARPSGEGWVYRSLRREEFTGEAVSYRAITALVVLMVGTGLLEHVLGHGRWVAAFGAKSQVSGHASRFRGTHRLMRLATKEGVRFDVVGTHFRPALPEPPLVLREGTYVARGTKHKGKRLPLPNTPRARSLSEELRALNAFLDGFPLTGGEHYGYIRIFSEADKTLRSGGRLYSQTDELSYQNLHPAQRRLRMTLGGEPVCELDIRASFLTILHARLGMAFDPSGEHPYARAGLERAVGKAWCTAAFGLGKPLRSWPAETVQRFAKDTGRDLRAVCKAKTASERLIATYPALGLLEDNPKVHWSVLQYVESEAIVDAMRQLMRCGVPSLSVHDSLIVPRAEQELALRILKACYERAVGARPVVTVKAAPEVKHRVA